MFSGIYKVMTHTPDALPDDPQELRRLAEQMARQLAAYEQQNREKDERIEQLLDYIQLLRQKRFGTKAAFPASASRSA